jgi:hypothetical protein
MVIILCVLRLIILMVLIILISVLITVFIFIIVVLLLFSLLILLVLLILLILLRCNRRIIFGRFFVRSSKSDAGWLTPVKELLGDMAENLQADCVQSRQAFLVRHCPCMKTHYE